MVWKLFTRNVNKAHSAVVVWHFCCSYFLFCTATVAVCTQNTFQNFDIRFHFELEWFQECQLYFSPIRDKTWDSPPRFAHWHKMLHYLITYADEPFRIQYSQNRECASLAAVQQVSMSPSICWNICPILRWILSRNYRCLLVWSGE